MENWIIDIVNNYGYIGIFLLIAIENIFPPIPSEVILTLGGFMTTSTSLTIPGVVLASTIGSIVGAIILYGIGLLMDVNRLEKIVERWGHILRLTKDDIYRANYQFNKHGVWAVFFCRLVPLIRSLISIPAGMSHMKFWSFLLLTGVGTLFWNIVLVNLGALVGSSWYKIVEYLDIYANFIYFVLAVLLLIGGIIYFEKRIKKQ
ncbi:MAG: DedA family protein [Zhaonellaceae bacterium]|jgi:membrane protein DedA with SNARE-associated domain|nr:DedA family protein [Clostridia bacterium]